MKASRLVLLGLVVVASVAIAYGGSTTPGRDTAPPTIDVHTICRPLTVQLEALQNEVRKSVLEETYELAPLTIELDDADAHVLLAPPSEPSLGRRLRDAWRKLQDSAVTVDRPNALPTRQIVVGDDCNQ